MSYDCSLIRYSPDFAASQPIHSTEWEKLVRAHSGLRLASALLPNDTLEVLTTAVIAGRGPADKAPATGLRGVLTSLRKLWKSKPAATASAGSKGAAEVWLGILSLADGQATFPQIALHQDSILETVLDVATELETCIVGQDGEVYFVPGIGLTWAELAPGETLFQSIEEVQLFRQKHGSTYAQVARQLMNQRGW